MFKPMYDLESLTEQQKQEYYLSACEHYGIPADLNLLAFIWMDSGDSKKTLQLYAKKGATDIIRANLGISTVKLVKDAGDGYVAWIAEGKDKTGRSEIAVGSASTAGLKGQNLASAVMIAQTRATRRMTLQFTGGGLLDESEVNDTTTDINRATAPLSAMATLSAPVQPTVTPNADMGKDVTKIEYNPEIARIIPTPPLMTAPEPFSSGNIISAEVETLVQIEPAPEAKKRHRRTKAEMGAAKVETTVTPNNGEYVTVLVTNSVPPTCEIHKEVMVLTFYGRPGGPPGNGYSCQSCCMERSVEQAAGQVIDEAVNQAAAELMPEVVYPTKEQEDVYRNRLKTYTNDILKTGGMADGIIWRVRKYTMHLFPDLLIENGKVKLTSKQWEHLLDSLDNQNKIVGPKGLVQIINEIAEKA
jgi:hypothetical protein